MSAPSFSTLSILVAAYNEQETLRPCLEAVLAAPLPSGLKREIILVDDGSRDATWAVAQQLAAEHPEIRIFQQSPNQGKGAAIRRAIAEMSGDLAIFQDADLEYDPRDYARLLRPILDDRADCVFGSRFTGEERKILYFWHTQGNRLLTLLSNMLNDTNLTDMETCYKAFTSISLKAIPLESNRFGIEPEITAKAVRNRLRLYEVPISYNGRRYDEGKKITWRDGLAALWFIVKYRFSSRYSDPGKVTLDAMEAAPAFNRWMYESVKPWLGRRVAELGVGRGNLSRHILGGLPPCSYSSTYSYSSAEAEEESKSKVKGKAKDPADPPAVFPSTLPYSYPCTYSSPGEEEESKSEGKSRSKEPVAGPAVLLTDYRTDYLQELQEKWRHHPGLQIAQLDLTAAADFRQLTAFAPDSVVFLNVLEHIDDDRAVLANLFNTVPPGCRLVILVPYNPRLYSDFDRQLGHFRRYERDELEGKLGSAGFEIETQFFFNKVGVLAWYVANTLGGQQALKPWQLRLYGWLTPLFRILDKVLPTAGLSTVVVGRKPLAPVPAPAFAGADVS